MNRRLSFATCTLATVTFIMLGTPLAAQAQEVGQVLSTAPVYQQVNYENRLVGYQVVYEYAGRQFSVQLPQDPGPTITLNITPQVLASVPPPPIVRTYVQPVFPPVVIGLGFGYGYGYGGPYGHAGHYGHRPYRHWR